MSGAAIVGGALALALLLSVYSHFASTLQRGGLINRLRLVRDTAILFRRLAADPQLPRGVRLRIFLGAAYLFCPIDLIPDFIPVIGHLDDALVVALVLRSTVRKAGAVAIQRHWPGSPDGLRTILRLATLPGRHRKSRSRSRHRMTRGECPCLVAAAAPPPVPPPAR